MAEIVRGRYRHFKGGVYIVIGTATHSETGEELVIYHKAGSGLVVTDEEQKLWARPVKMWNETVYRHGSEKPRFELLNTIPAADAVEVVRCRDCANWDTTWEPETLPEGHFCLELALMTKADFFCAAGEKRETEDDQ